MFWSRPEAGTPEENWVRAEREFLVAHDYDTLDRDLARVGMTLSRLPSEAGVMWRLVLARGERVLPSPVRIVSPGWIITAYCAMKVAPAA